MKANAYLDRLRAQFNDRIELCEKRPDIYQLIAPLYHEDGDMVDIFLEQGKRSLDTVRICDHGMTLMRLSYSYDINTHNKERIFQTILSENKIEEDNGNLFIEARHERIYPALLQFAQTVAKITNMQLFKREVIQSLFYEMLEEFITTSLSKYNPRPKTYPISDRDDLEVDFQFDLQKSRPVYLFGIKDNAKARLTTISCLEFQRAKIPYRSLVVHEDFEGLSRKDRNRITSAADKQFPSLDDFKENAQQVFEREVA